MKVAFFAATALLMLGTRLVLPGETSLRSPFVISQASSRSHSFEYNDERRLSAYDWSWRHLREDRVHASKTLADANGAHAIDVHHLSTQSDAE
jgi:hypothetical protein